MWPWLIGGGALLAAVAALLNAQKRASGGVSVATTPSRTPVVPSGDVIITNGIASAANGSTYTFTDEDKLWLGRAVLGEAGESQQGGAAVCWAMITNYLTSGPRGGTRFHLFPTFWRLLRAYCQPINPAWMDPAGAKCRRQPAACTARHIARRQDMSTRPWDRLPSSVRVLVESFLAGTLPNPVPGATGWNMRRWAPDNIEVDGNFFGRERR